MNKKEYKKPIFKPVEVESSTLLAGSLGDNVTIDIGGENGPGDGGGEHEAESNFSFWDDEE